MPEAVRAGDLTDHSMPIQGAGSPDVFIGGQKAWRAMPEGAGAGLDEPSKAVKEILDKPMIRPPEVMPKLPQIAANMIKVAAQAEKAGAMGATATVSTGLQTLAATAIGLVATYTAAAAVPGGEPAAATAFTLAFQTALAQTMTAAVQAIAGPWDMDTCAQAGGTGPHGPGVVIKASTTVFINGLPAVMKGNQVIEATGGPSTIQVGCGTVIIGDKTPAGGDTSSGKGKSADAGTRPAKARKGSPAPVGSRASAAASPPDAGPKEVIRFDLWVRLHVDPRDSASINDVFQLISTDGSVSLKKTVADDQLPNDDCLDLLFEQLELEKSYSLRVIDDGEEHWVFEGVTGSQLHGDWAATKSEKPAAIDLDDGEIL